MSELTSTDWMQDIDTTNPSYDSFVASSSSENTYLEYVKIWDQVFSPTKDTKNNPAKAMSDFDMKNGDRLTFLLRKYTNSTCETLSIEEEVRLEMLEKQVERMNPRYGDNDLQAITNFADAIEDLVKSLK